MFKMFRNKVKQAIDTTKKLDKIIVLLKEQLGLYNIIGEDGARYVQSTYYIKYILEVLNTLQTNQDPSNLIDMIVSIAHLNSAYMYSLKADREQPGQIIVEYQAYMNERMGYTENTNPVLIELTAALNSIPTSSRLRGEINDIINAYDYIINTPIENIQGFIESKIGPKSAMNRN